MTKPTVLIVDDIDVNLMILEEILQDTYNVVKASSGLDAVDMLFNAVVVPKIVLLDIMMPDMDGYQVLEIIKSNPALNKIPVIFITASGSESTALAAGAVDYISKPFYPEIVRLRVANHIRLKNYSDSLESMVAQKVEELTATRNQVLQAMANIIEYRNLESGGHVKRTTEFTQALVNHLLSHPIMGPELETQNPSVIINSVSLHDVGKIGIPDEILLKPGRLTAEEFDIIKTHAKIGKDIVESILALEDSAYRKHCSDICYCHHERYDGKGYPRGLAGEDIPLSARILSIVDVYDALVNERVYKDAFSHEAALQIIQEGLGTQFDPIIAQATLDIENTFQEISRSIRS